MKSSNNLIFPYLIYHKITFSIKLQFKNKHNNLKKTNILSANKIKKVQKLIKVSKFKRNETNLNKFHLQTSNNNYSKNKSIIQFLTEIVQILKRIRIYQLILIDQLSKTIIINIISDILKKSLVPFKIKQFRNPLRQILLSLKKFWSQNKKFANKIVICNGFETQARY